MSKKFEIVACVGNPWDYSCELIDVVSHWKEARNYISKGADVYLDGKKIYFIDHKAVEQAFKDLRLDAIVDLDVVEDDSFIADVKRKSAYDTLKENGLSANETWSNIIEARYRNSLRVDPLKEPLYKRHIQFVPLYNAETHELVKVINGKIESDDLPF